MRFDELCLMYENITLIKGNFGQKMSADDYVNGITNFIKKNNNTGLGSIHFFLNKPFSKDNCLLNLNYYFIQTPASPPIPARSFKYEIPESTLIKFRSNPNIRNNRAPVYFKPQINVFYLDGKPIRKVFPESYLKEAMKELIKVNNYFESNYGKQFSFLGEVYTQTGESTASKLASSWERTKEGWKNLPKDLGTWIKNI